MKININSPVDTVKIETPVLSRKAGIFICFFAVVYLAVNFIYLDKYPVPGRDDSDGYVGPAYTFVKEGVFKWPTYPPALYSNNFFLTGRMHHYYEAIFIKLFGFSIITSRIGPFAAGIASLFLFFLLMKKLYGSRVGLMSVVLFSMSSLFIVVSHSVRPEPVCLCLLLLMLLLFLRSLEKKNKSLYFFTGFTALFALSFHHSAIAFPFILAGLICYKWKEISTQQKIYSFLGALCGVVVFLVVYSPLTISISQIIQFKETAGVFNTNIFKLAQLEFSRYYFYFWKLKFHRNVFVLVIFLFAVIARIAKKDKWNYLMLMPVVIPPVVYTVFAVTKSTHTIFFMFPFLIGMASAAISDLSDSRVKLLRISGSSVLLFLFIFFIIENISIMVLYGKVHPYKFENELRALVPKGSRIIGPQSYWIFFPDEDYLSTGVNRSVMSLSKENASLKKEFGVTFREVAIKTKREYVVMDNSALNDETTAFIDENCTKAGEISDRVFGGPDQLSFKNSINKVMIYKVNANLKP